MRDKWNQDWTQCNDLVGFQDKYGEGCEFYQPMCEKHWQDGPDGEKVWSPKGKILDKLRKFAGVTGQFKGVGAGDACCVCGGGKSKEEIAQEHLDHHLNTAGCHNY